MGAALQQRAGRHGRGDALAALDGLEAEGWPVHQFVQSPADATVLSTLVDEPLILMVVDQTCQRWPPLTMETLRPVGEDLLVVFKRATNEADVGDRGFNETPDDGSAAVGARYVAVRRDVLIRAGSVSGTWDVRGPGCGRGVQSVVTNATHA